MSVDLHRIAALFRASLPPDARIDLFRIDALDRLGIPVVQATLTSEGGHAIDGYGYGMTAVEAEVGALGELCEEAHVGAFVTAAPFVTASHAELVARHGPRGVVDPLKLCLAAGSPYTTSLELDWVEARRHPSGETVLVPLEWVAAYPSQMQRPARLITPITNGLGAGLDTAHAIAHGVMELLQRDGNVISFRALDQGRVISLDILPADAALLVQQYRDAGISLQVKLADTDFGITNLYVVGDDSQAAIPIQITSCGEAAHPDRGHGLRKALLEFAGSRARKAATHGPIDMIRGVMPEALVERRLQDALANEEESRAVEAMAAWMCEDAAGLRSHLANCVFSSKTEIALSTLPTVPPGSLHDATARLAWLTERLAREGLDILWVDCSPLGSPVRVVKTIVPGLDAETMSYHRIGRRGVAKLRARGDRLILDAPRVGAARVRLHPDDEELSGGPAWYDIASADAMVERLYPLYRESGPFAAQLLHARRRC